MVSSVRSDARGYWKANTLPWPEPGIRLLRRSQVEEFQAKMGMFGGHSGRRCRSGAGI